ncbi:unnamed protein product [Caenorhabditis sp. 36 PRJEB53466]|nr:unnamed protein product [Caenorhabditis sp. 36 PRJEB53466]
MLLELDLNEYLRVELERVQEEEEGQKSRKQTELQLKMIDKRAVKAAALARKVLRWPIGQTPPTQIVYLRAEEELLISGPTSEMSIPLAKSKIDSLTATAIARSGTSSKAKTFSAFAVNPIEIFDVRSIAKAVQNVVETPEKEKKWKQLAEKLTEHSPLGEASGALSAVEQVQFVEAVRKYVDDVDSDEGAVGVLLMAVAKSRILTFKNEDVFLRMCVAKEKQGVVEAVLFDSSRVVSEYILAELLKLASTKKNAEERFEQVVKVLSRNYSKRSMKEAVGQVLSAAESVEIMQVLTEVYRQSVVVTDDDDGVADRSGKALALITVLMDAHGSRIVYEDKLHTKFAAVSNFLIEMQSLIGTYSRLEAAVEECADQIPANNVVIEIFPTAHPMVW